MHMSREQGVAALYLYSKTFARCLSAIMAKCEDDLYRSRFTPDSWEESGENDIERKRAQIFRMFLQDGLAIDVDHVYLDCNPISSVSSSRSRSNGCGESSPTLAIPRRR